MPPRAILVRHARGPGAQLTAAARKRDGPGRRLRRRAPARRRELQTQVRRPAPPRANPQLAHLRGLERVVRSRVFLFWSWSAFASVVDLRLAPSPAVG